MTDRIIPQEHPAALIRREREGVTPQERCIGEDGRPCAHPALPGNGRWDSGLRCAFHQNAYDRLMALRP